MGWTTPDVVNQPEKFGLTVVGMVEWYAPCWDYDETYVLMDKDGTLYWADDAGCSCPSPFEDFTSLDKCSTGTRDELFAHLDECLESLYRKDGYADPQVVELKAKVLSVTA